MIDLLFVALFQAAAGAPAEPATPAPDQTAAPADQATPAPSTTDQQVDPQQQVRCRTQRLTGSRVRTARICTTPEQDAERARTNRRIMNGMQNGGSGQPRDFSETGGGGG